MEKERGCTLWPTAQRAGALPSGPLLGVSAVLVHLCEGTQSSEPSLHPVPFGALPMGPWAVSLSGCHPSSCCAWGLEMHLLLDGGNGLLSNFRNNMPHPVSSSGTHFCANDRVPQSGERCDPC